uniref:Uncharacterized protein n=1 Tax=Ananas comosus var. bracteatus TaxID=296719 RepID=A0A6V7QYX0_ANACO
MYATKPLSIFKAFPETAFQPPLEGPVPGTWILTVQYDEEHARENTTYSAVVFFIPVLDKPLSSNHYYVVSGKGKDKGKIYTCSKEEDMSTCCFCRCINDVKPSPFDHRNIYQQMEIVPKKGSSPQSPQLPMVLRHGCSGGSIGEFTRCNRRTTA